MPGMPPTTRVMVATSIPKVSARLGISGSSSLCDTVTTGSA